MPKDGKIYVKPQSLAQKNMTGYDKVKQETMERNSKIMNALGLKSIPYPFCSSQSTREGKSNVDGDESDESDEDFHPPENVEGLNVSSDDDKVHGSQKKKLAAAKGGVEPDRLEVFQKTHTKKDGKPVDEASKIAIARIDERISQVPVSLQSATYREEVFTDVLGQDTHGRVRTFGLGPCPSQVWGTRFTRSRELRDRDQLRAEVRKEVLAEVDDRLSRLERKCARFEAHAKDIGYPLPPSPEDDSPISPSHNGQSCNEEHVLDANSPQQQNGYDMSRPLRAWTDEELMYEM